MAKRSFIDECTPHRPRQRPIPWPLGGERKVLVRILSDIEIERAYLATCDHFKALKRTVGGKEVVRAIDFKDPAFEHRERLERVFLAFRCIDEDGTKTDKPIVGSADELAEYPDGIVDALYFAWSEYQSEAGAKPVDDAAVKRIVEELKKNTPAALLLGLPSTWLIAVITTLVEPSSTSETSKSSGSSE